MKKLNWSAKSKKEKKRFLIKYVGGGLFILVGTIFGIVALAMYGWNFTKFITDPTVDLITLCCIGIGVVMFNLREVK